MKKAFPLLLILCLASTLWTASIANNPAMAHIEIIRSEHDSSQNKAHFSEHNENQKIITFLTFQKEDAEQAMNFYIALFDNSKVIDVKRWGAEGPGKEGTIMHATFSLNGVLFMCSDSPPIHDWDFTPGVSNYVECEDANEIEQLFSKLSKDGEVAMPLNNYGFSEKFGWVVDQFGVSWQLNLN